ncbi:hypothetical protein [Streptomyces beihaiensis]|uniref:Lipoprotein n=1 Tax=Streptomyces beihaiensis TaxID=2984495 RepID=A0ABT3U161_9ACTN|nr:hypothetical protein [Streptomyces beihaiensis]MCX3061990.1 hypothetical protein [Streptomyces beihaiensis]
MRSISLAPSLASTAAASLAVLALSTPLAMADDGGRQSNITSFGFSVTPSTVAPGGTVTLNATGCEVPTVTVDSPVFDSTQLNEGHSAIATVYPDAKPGAQYDVIFDCDGEKGSTTLTISSGGTNRPHGVRAGVGGSIGEASPSQIAAGAALIVGSLATAVHRGRRRRTDGS